MASNSDSNKKGFSGLTNLSSKIQELPSDQKKAEDASPQTVVSSDPVKHERSPEANNQPSTHSDSSPKTTSRGTEKNVKGLQRYSYIIFFGLIFAALLGYNWFKQNSNENRSDSKASIENKSSKSPAVKPFVSKETPKLKYEKPAVGTSRVLSVEEIRWCMRERIRLETMESVINNNRAIGAFNLLADSYNSRCGRYRYRTGNQKRAERDVEANRTQIEFEARLEGLRLNKGSR